MRRKVHELYVLVFPNGKRYFGISSDAADRFRHHKARARNGSKLPVHCAIRKYGERVVFHKLLIGNRDYIAAAEISMITEYGTTNPCKGYNVTPGGDVSPMHDEKTRAKLRGRVVSPEGRRNISAAAKKRGMLRSTAELAHSANRGRPFSDSHLHKLSAARRRRPWPAELVAKIAASNRGRKRSGMALDNIRLGAKKRVAKMMAAKNGAD